MEWIDIEQKKPPAHKLCLGLVEFQHGYRLVQFRRRGTIKDNMYQDNENLNMLDVKYWILLPKIPDIKKTTINYV